MPRNLTVLHSLRVPPELKERLDNMADKTGLGVSDIVRLAVNAHLDRIEKDGKIPVLATQPTPTKAERAASRLGQRLASILSEPTLAQLSHRILEGRPVPQELRTTIARRLGEAKLPPDPLLRAAAIRAWQHKLDMRHLLQVRPSGPSLQEMIAAKEAGLPIPAPSPAQKNGPAGGTSPCPHCGLLIATGQP